MRLIIFFLTVTFINCSYGQLQEGFVYLDEFIPSIKTELRYYGNNNFIGTPIEGYERERAILSIQAAVALKAVQSELEKSDLSLKIYDSYRPQRAVNHFIKWARNLNDTLNKSRYYPDVDKKNLFKEEYIATRSGHSRGSTLDLTIVDMITCEELDMGSSYDFFGRESWVAYKGISTQQRANRALLQNVMLKHGFRNYPKEWWHFTLRNEPYPNTYFDFVIE
ncbi:MAG: M15 family metallopeptidase [Flavobacteriaceae bacterium]|nr:M15 family metallopeptidase [Bacteroidia bacterium]NNF75245.1 M15 family metallopeptidase [Flavobacteriaceae bacterium]NNK74208.1 M15 family metallopeptidase [Flavobacteriaceae bacterium]